MSNTVKQLIEHDLQCPDAIQSLDHDELVAKAYEFEASVKAGILYPAVVSLIPCGSRFLLH